MTYWMKKKEYERAKMYEPPMCKKLYAAMDTPLGVTSGVMAAYS